MKQCLWCFLWCLPVVVYGQQAAVASGGDVQGTGGSVAYSIGQVDYQSYSNDTWQINEGVQQPVETFQISSVGNSPEFTVQIGPNPVSNEIYIRADQSVLFALSFELFDIQGKRIKALQSVPEDGKIDLAELPAASYQLVIYNLNEPIHNYKLIKHSPQ